MDKLFAKKKKLILLKHILGYRDNILCLHHNVKKNDP